MNNPADVRTRPWVRRLASVALLMFVTVSIYLPAEADEIIEDGTAEEALAPGIKLRIESCGYEKPRQILVQDDDDATSDDDDATSDDDDATSDDDDATSDDDDATSDDDDSSTGDDDDSSTGDDDDSSTGDDDDSSTGDDDDSARS